MKTLRARNLLASLVLAFAGIAHAAGPENSIIAVSGNLPILLTVPHGGTDGVSGVPARSRGTTVTDTYTIELATALAEHLERTLGAKPYVVAARFSRKFIDANRSEGEAFETPDAKPVYDAYHDQIRLFGAEMKQRFPRGVLLLDIHGQSDDPGMLHRGTQNGATVAALLRRHGAQALVGQNSIFGVIQARGYSVFPPNTPIGDPRENPHLNGGFTVQTYGSGKANGMDAIQLEIGRHLRRDAGFIAALGDAVGVFYKAYLAADKPPSSGASAEQTK
jgi:N-formylglutamate amidohydrolase